MLTPSNPDAATTLTEAENAAKAQTADAAIDRAFGLWADHKEDGLAYQERMRSEWDERQSDLDSLLRHRANLTFARKA